MTMQSRSSESGARARYYHLSSLDLGIDSLRVSGVGETGVNAEAAGDVAAEVTAICVAGTSLILGLSDGRVALRDANDAVGLGSSSSWYAPFDVGSWNWRQLRLPPEAGLPMALAARAAGSAIVGTSAGWLVRCWQPGAGPDEVVPLSTAHQDVAVSALIFGPEVEVMDFSQDGIEANASRAATLFSGDTAGRVYRKLLAVDTLDDGRGGNPGELCAELGSQVVAMELCERTGRLLVSSVERIAVIDSVLELGAPVDALDGSERIRLVGSKPHKGHLTATFSRVFGPQALVAARPGGRLWVADAASGTVTHTLKKFHGVADGQEKKTSFGRLIAVGDGTLMSWSSVEALPASTCGPATTLEETGGAVTLLDLDAIAIIQEWCLPHVVGVSRLHSHCVILAHRRSVSVLLLHDSPSELLHALLVGGGAMLRRSARSPSAGGDGGSFISGVLNSVQKHRSGLVVATSASELLVQLRPLVAAVTALERNATPLSGQASEEVASFKEWVEELERVEAEELRAQDGPAFLVAAAPLANFPVADGGHELSGVSLAAPQWSDYIALTDRDFRETTVWTPTECTCKQSDNGASGGLHGYLTPKMLNSCGEAQRAATTPRIPAFIASRDLNVHDSSTMDPVPEPCSAVKISMGCVPFYSTPAVVSFLVRALQWIVVATEGSFDSLGRKGEASSALAPVVFELLCLYAAPRVHATSSGQCDSPDKHAAEQSGWPILALDALHEDVSISDELASDSFQDVAVTRDELRDMLNRLANSALDSSSCVKDESRKGEPWAVCQTLWTAEMALAFCRELLIAVPEPALERCFVRANGLAALGARWPVVANRLSSRLRAANASTACLSQGHPSARILYQNSVASCVGELSGVVEMHAKLGDMLRGVGAADAEISNAYSSVCVRDVLQMALLQFPSILPWNVDQWCRRALEAVASTREPLRAFLREHFAGELLQYLLRLLPTVSTWAHGTRPILNAVLALALHGYRRGATAPQLHCGPNAVIDSLVAFGYFGDGKSTSHGALWLLESCYPLGALTLASQALDGDEDALFEQTVTSVLDCLVKHSEPSDGAPPGAGIQSFRALVMALRRFCSGDKSRWERFLYLVGDRVAAVGDDKDCKGGAVEQLVAALAAVNPDPSVASVCLRAARVGALGDVLATASASWLWAAARELQVPHVASPSAGPSTWLALPSPRAEPARPKLAAAVPEIAAVPSQQASTGFYRGSPYVYVSDDGLFARHRDDTGEEMHGVVIGAERLSESDVGLYFEVQVDEVRREEMPDGLTIGVTATSPAAAALASPVTAEHLPHTWTVGYDGQMWDASEDTLCTVDWDPRCLQEGDLVGVLVTSSNGELLVFRNGIACCPGPRGIPVGLCPLFAVVDLLGAARAVRWREGAMPPIGSA